MSGAAMGIGVAVVATGCTSGAVVGVEAAIGIGAIAWLATACSDSPATGIAARRVKLEKMLTDSVKIFSRCDFIKTPYYFL